METIIHDQSPLAQYLNDAEDVEHDIHHHHSHSHSHEKPLEWSPPAADDTAQFPTITPPPSPPSPRLHNFAPTGRPFVRSRFHGRIPKALSLDITTRSRRLTTLQDGATAVATRIDRADNAKFLERFRYTIIASQLLSGHTILGSTAGVGLLNKPNVEGQGVEKHTPDEIGLLLTAIGALGLAWFVSWLYKGGYANLTKKRGLVFVVVFVVAAAGAQAFLRQRWLAYVRDQATAEINIFVRVSQDFDVATSSAIALVQEVELVSRGYRLGTPLPPISRIEDRSQSRRCNRLRKAVRASFSATFARYQQVVSEVKSLAEPMDLEKYYDIYDLGDLDMADATQGYNGAELEDLESLRALKIGAARLHILRKMFLCASLAVEARGDASDFNRWNIVAESLRSLNEITKSSCERIKAILGEEEAFTMTTPPPDRTPLSPGRERWRTNLRKLTSLTTGIRGLQAKMALLREESDRALNETDDISEVGPTLMAQYDSIGQDLRMLQQAWEEGRLALASGINRNEKRISSISGILSPSPSLSGLTTVEEHAGGGGGGGGAAEALRALTGATTATAPLSDGGMTDFASNSAGDSEEMVFEAVAGPAAAAAAALRQKSTLSREDRMAKMREDREKRAEVKERAEGQRGMLKELEMVINLRPNRAKSTPPAAKRIVSM